MTTPIETLEGRVIAQRKLLAMILGAMPEDAEIWRQLDRRAVSENHEEDPGVVPDEAFAIEAAISSELWLITDAAKSFREGKRDI
jgi:hypothetical protein